MSDELPDFTTFNQEMSDLYTENNYSEIITKTSSLLSQMDSAELTTPLALLATYWKSYALRKTGAIDKALDLVSTVLDEINQLDQRSNEYELIWLKSVNLKAFTYVKLKKYDKAFSAATTVINRIDAMDDDQKTQYLNELGYAHNTKATAIRLDQGDTDTAIEHYITSLDVFTEDNNVDRLIQPLINLHQLYYQQADIANCDRIFDRIVAIKDQVRNKEEVIQALINMGMTSYQHSGDLPQAMKYFQEALGMSRQINSRMLQAQILNSIAVIYFERGLYQKSEKYFQQALEIDISGDNWIYNALVWINYCYLLIETGANDDAEKYINKAYDAFTDTNHGLQLAQALFLRVRIDLINDRLDRAKTFLNELDELKQRNDDKRIDQYYNLTRGLILMQSKRSTKTVLAMEIFESIIDGPMIDFYVSVMAMKSLVFLWIEELIRSGEMDLLDNISTKLEQLKEFAKSNQSYSLQVETLVLESKLALLELKFAKGQRLLEEAQSLADQWNLQLLSKSISSQYEKLHDEIHLWEELKENLSFDEIVKFSGISAASQELLQRTAIEEPQIPEEEPINYMLISDNGIAAYGYTFDTEFISNDMLISNLLTALTTMANEVFDKELQRIFIGDYTILMQRKHNLTHGYIFKGSSYHASGKLDRLIELLSNDSKLSEHLDKRSHVAIEDTELENRMDRIVEASIQGKLTNEK